MPVNSKYHAPIYLPMLLSSITSFSSPDGAPASTSKIVDSPLPKSNEKDYDHDNTDNESNSSTDSETGTKTSSVKDGEKIPSDAGTSEKRPTETKKLLFRCDFCPMKSTTAINLRTHVLLKQ